MLLLIFPAYLIYNNLTLIKFSKIYLVEIVILYFFLVSIVNLLNDFVNKKFIIRDIIFTLFISFLNFHLVDFGIVFSQPTELKHNIHTLSIINNNQKEILLKAQDHNFYKVVSLKNKNKEIILLGETHIKGDEASKLGQDLVKEFPAFAVEGINSNEFPILTKILRAFYYIPRKLFKSSTIDEVDKFKDKKVYLLEYSPLLSHYDKEMDNYPFYKQGMVIFRRNLRMRDNIIKAMKKEDVLVVILGKMHIPDLVNLLNKNGFH